MWKMENGNMKIKPLWHHLFMYFMTVTIAIFLMPVTFHVFKYKQRHDTKVSQFITTYTADCS